jgi:PIN domain nuclease of toxin-antitoxin system
MLVVDSSALMAFIRDEDGAGIVEKHLTNGLLMSVVNYGETKGKLIGSGTHTPAQVDAVFGQFAGLLELAEFDLTQAEGLAYFYARRNPYALSLVDCACLALAEARGLGVLTAEQGWKKLPGLRVKVKLIR